MLGLQTREQCRGMETRKSVEFDTCTYSHQLMNRYARNLILARPLSRPLPRATIIFSDSTCVECEECDAREGKHGT